MIRAATCCPSRSANTFSPASPCLNPTTGNGFAVCVQLVYCVSCAAVVAGDLRSSFLQFVVLAVPQSCLLMLLAQPSTGYPDYRCTSASSSWHSRLAPFLVCASSRAECKPPGAPVSSKTRSTHCMAHIASIGLAVLFNGFMCCAGGSRRQRRSIYFVSRAVGNRHGLYACASRCADDSILQREPQRLIAPCLITPSCRSAGGDV